MIIMALDHIRDFFHSGAMLFSPEDLSRTTPVIFLTRWITHFCAPVFMFTAGMGAYFWLQRHKSKMDLSKFLLTRGLWLVILVVTVMRLALSDSADRALGARLQHDDSGRADLFSDSLACRAEYCDDRAAQLSGRS
jgi:uncharacterized membrane protein